MRILLCHMNHTLKYYHHLFEFYDPFNVISLAHKWIGRWNHLLSNCWYSQPPHLHLLSPCNPRQFSNLVKFLQWPWNLLILCKIMPGEKPILYSTGTGQAPRPPIISFPYMEHFTTFPTRMHLDMFSFVKIKSFLTTHYAPKVSVTPDT